MKLTLLIIVSTLIIGNLVMFWHQDTKTLSGTHSVKVSKHESHDVQSSQFVDKGDKKLKKLSGVAQSIKTTRNSVEINENLYRNKPQYDTDFIVDPLEPDYALSPEEIQVSDGNTEIQDTGEFIDPDDDIMIMSMLEKEGDETVYDTGEFISADVE